MLPRLPDTAEELKSISLALQADPSKALFLGKDANERKVKSTDLSKFKIVAFATHGLVPGEIDGLTQPALALSAPDVAGVDGDGLLTMEEVLGLRLEPTGSCSLPATPAPARAPVRKRLPASVVRSFMPVRARCW